MKKVEYLQGKDIVFNKRHKSKKKTNVQTPEINQTFPSLTPSEQSQLCSSFSQCLAKDRQNVQPVFLSVIREHAESYSMYLKQY